MTKVVIVRDHGKEECSVTSNLVAVSAVVAALLTLLGVFVGQLLNRGTEYHKWLRQERYIVFSRLLAATESVRNESAHFVTLVDTAKELPSLLPSIKERIDELIEFGVGGTNDTVTFEEQAYDNLRASMLKQLGGDPISAVVKALQVTKEIDLILVNVRLLVSENIYIYAVDLRDASRNLYQFTTDTEWWKGLDKKYVTARKNFVNAAHQVLK
jgi:hypothetical protein